MRFSNSLWKISPALLAMAALILIAGAAAGQEFFNYAAGINPEENYQGSSGWLEAQDDEYSTGVYAMCSNDIIAYEIGCESWHPDKVNVTKTQAQVDQKKRNNNAVAWMAVTLLGGEEVDIEEELECEKVQLKGKGNTRNDRIDAKCTIKKCKLPSGVTVGDIDDAKECAADAKESGDLGKRVGNISRNNDDELSGSIKSKGTPES